MAVVANNGTADAHAPRDLLDAATWGGSDEAAARYRRFATVHYTCVLDVHTCNLTELPRELGLLPHRMTKFHCEENPLSAIPEELGQCVTLDWLYCTNTLLTAVPAWVFDLPVLRTIGMSHCRLDAAALCDVAEGVRRSGTLTTIHVEGNPESLNAKVALAFARALRSNRTLTTLSLTGFMSVVTDPPAVGEEITSALTRNTRGDAAPAPYAPLVKAAR